MMTGESSTIRSIGHQGKFTNNWKQYRDKGMYDLLKAEFSQHNHLIIISLCCPDDKPYSMLFRLFPSDSNVDGGADL